MSLAFDEYGRPFLIIKVRIIIVSLFVILSLFRSRAFILCRVVLLRRRKESHRDRKTNVSSHRFSLCIIEQEQSSKQRLRGIEAQKANILAAKSVARTLRSSLGPKVWLFVFYYNKSGWWWWFFFSSFPLPLTLVCCWLFRSTSDFVEDAPFKAVLSATLLLSNTNTLMILILTMVMIIITTY